MPLGKGVRYRMKDGVRLAFKGNQVVETKNMKTGATHTPAEFKEDRKMMKDHMKMMKSHMPPGGKLSPAGDIGAMRQKEATRAIKAFKGDGEVVTTAGKFGPLSTSASRAGTDPKA